MHEELEIGLVIDLRFAYPLLSEAAFPPSISKRPVRSPKERSQRLGREVGKDTDPKWGLSDPIWDSDL